MATMLLDQDDPSVPAGVAGESRSDGVDTGAEVTLTSTGGGTSHEFRILWHPTADVNAVSTLIQTGNPAIWTFSPTALAYGSYRIDLIVDLGLPTESRTERVFGIRTPNKNILIPAWNEGADPDGSLMNLGPLVIKESIMNEAGNPTGWWLSQEQAMLSLDAAIDSASQLDIRFRQTTLQTYIDAQVMNITVPKDGWYRVDWMFLRQMDTTSGKFDYFVEVTGTGSLFPPPGNALIEVQDIANQEIESGFGKILLTAGVHDIKIRFQVTVGSTATIYFSRLTFVRCDNDEELVS